jgi:ketosteroid isomerase-like protein
LGCCCNCKPRSSAAGRRPRAAAAIALFANGTVVKRTGESFEVVLSTVARWRDGRVVEEYLT